MPVMMRRVRLIVAALAVGVLVAIIYSLFEWAVSNAIHQLWLDTFDTDTNRFLVIPLAIGLGVLYFAAMHFIEDGEAAKKRPPLIKLSVVLVVGFFSLLAGASLGPEAILIPASLIAGTLASRWMRLEKDAKILGLAGFVALFVAFFNSILGGLLGLYLALKTQPQKLGPFNYVLLLFTALAAFVTLGALPGKGSFEFPAAGTSFSLLTIILSVGFFAAGVLSQRILEKTVSVFQKFKKQLSDGWLKQGLVAGAGLSIIFLLGGPLVQFTGNESIVPVFEQAKDIGVIGLVWIVVMKLVAIAWSIVIGYRGGLIFPLIFVGSAVVATVTLYTSSFNLILGIFIFLAGALVADRKSKVITNHTVSE